jgi:nucleoside-diphosphate-sugar epimerase
MAKPPVVILVSSAAAGGPSNMSTYRTEADPPAPVSNYGRSKLAGERVAIAGRGDCPLSIVRPGIVFGPGDTEFIRIFRAMTRARVNPMIGSGHQPLSMIEVRDLVHFLLRVAEHGERVAHCTDAGDSEAGQGVYNAADPTPLSLRQLGNLVRKAMPGLRFLDLPMPVRLGFVVGAISEFGSRLLGKYPTLNRDKIREARAPGWALNVEKSLRGLGWEPQRPLPDRLTETFRHALQAGEL